MTGVDGSEVVLFSRQLATMVAAGLPLTQAIGIIGEQNDNPEFKGVLIRIRDDLAGGRHFPDALAKHPQFFSTFYVQISRAGDTGGNLDIILDRLAWELERPLRTGAGTGPRCSRPSSWHWVQPSWGWD